MELHHDVKNSITNFEERVRQRHEKKLTKDQQKELQQLEFKLELWCILEDYKTCNNKKPKTEKSTKDVLKSYKKVKKNGEENNRPCEQSHSKR